MKSNIDKLTDLINTDDINNHILAYQLAKSQSIDMIDVIRYIFHNKECWNTYYKYDISLNTMIEFVHSYYKTIFNIHITVGLRGSYVDNVFINDNSVDLGIDYDIKGYRFSYNTAFENEEEILNHLVNKIEEYINNN